MPSFKVASVLADFNPRSPCGERRAPTYDMITLSRISIHALLAESDMPICPTMSGPENFNPRSPCGERRALGKNILAGRNFNPRSPCGERPHDVSIYDVYAQFQSTLSLRRATASLHRGVASHTVFQSTLSLRRATVHRNATAPGHLHFNPRSPCGERQSMFVDWRRHLSFQSTLSLRRATANTTKLALSFLSKVPI